MQQDELDLQAARRAVITVGDGRGFILNSSQGRYVVTAAHCLPQLPEPPAFDDITQTYRNLLGPLGSVPSVSASCLFADPVADIAVLGSPDEQEMYEEADAYTRLLGSLEALAVGGDLPENAFVWILGLGGSWTRCSAQWLRGLSPGPSPLWVTGAAEGIRPGMSGSPIVSEKGLAVGIISTSLGYDVFHKVSGPSPQLRFALPRWIDDQLTG
jgi:hypothetical protein